MKVFINLVDKDVQLMLFPLNLMLYLIVSPKYRIKYNYITPNGSISNRVLLTGTVLFMVFFIHYSVVVSLYKYRVSIFKYITNYFDCVFYCFGLAMNFINGIIHKNNFIQFVLSFQKVHRLLNNKTFFNDFIIWNWIIVIVALSFYLIIFTYFFLRLGFPFYFILVCYLLAVFDFNVVYATRLIKLLKSKVVLWNTLILNDSELQDTHCGNYRKEVFQAYVHILKCYDNHKVCFQQFILYYITEVFIHTLVYIEDAIDMMKFSRNLEETTLTSGAILCWLLKDLTWLTMLILECDKFYLAIESVQDTCALLLKSTCSDDEKKLCKNILRLNRASFSKIRVCGLFYVDVALQLNMMSLLTNYTIVLLQFAFL